MSNSHVLTKEEIDEFQKHEKFEIPNVTELLKQIMEIIVFLKTPEMIELSKKDNVMYEQLTVSKYPIFADRYGSIFKMIMSGDSLTPLFDMLKMLDTVRNGDKSFEEVDEKLKSDLADKYIYKGMPEDKKKEWKRKLKDYEKMSK